MKKIIATLLALVMLLTLVPTAFASSDAADAGDGTPVRGGTLRIGQGLPLSSLDPTKVTARDSDYSVICQVYEPLIRSDASGNLVPGLAESWDVVDDTTIVFYLRQDVSFHDGTPFNAEAVKANFEYFTDESVASIFATELEVLDTVEVVDDYTVQVTLKEPSSMFLTDLTNYSGLMIAPSALEQGADYLAANTCGTGPFEVTDYVEGVSVTLTANPDYYLMGSDGKPLPYVDAVEFTMMSDQTTKVNSLKAGDIDLTDYLATTGIEELEGSSDFALQRIVTSDIYTIFCNVQDPVMSNVKLRQALAYAIDRESLAEALSRGYGSAANWACDPSQWFYSDYDPYTYDVDKAKELLAEAGYEDGLTMTMQCISREPDNTIMQVLQAQFAEIGVNVELQSMERTEWVSIWTVEHTGQIGLAKMTVPRVDPYVQLNTNMGVSSANNYSLYDGEKFNELLTSLSSLYDIEEQKAALAQAQQIYLDDCASIFLYQMPRYNGYSNKVQNLTALALGAWDLSQIWLTQ